VLKLPIAPVVVRLPEPDNGWPYYSSLSLASLVSGRPWGTGGGAHLDKAAPALEALRVFWTWIGDSDHNAHDQNLLFEVQAEKCAVVAIDHSFSLCHGNHTDPLAVGVSSGYATAGRPDCHAVLRRTVTKILSLSQDIVDKMVRRLEAILTVDEQNRILRILVERRNNLSRLLGI
jgi:hypothetical protein